MLGTRDPGAARAPAALPRLQPGIAASAHAGPGPLPLPGGLGAAGPCSPARWPSSRPRRLSPHLFSSPRPLRTGGGCLEVLHSSSSGPGGPSWLRRVNPLHAAVPHRFRYRRGEVAGIANKTQELVCDSSARIPPVPRLSSRSFLGRSCPMFEPFLPTEDGLKAASWGLFWSRSLCILKEVMGLALACLPAQLKSC